MRFATLSCLVFMLFGLMPTTVNAQVNGRVLDAGKGATGLVLLDGNRGSGSCFCIDAEGYFVTNAHVVRGEIGAAIIMNPNTDNEFELDAKVVVRDGGSDLALLKADMGKNKVTPLKLADSNKLRETDELVAFGFPLGEFLAFERNEYPAVSVNVGRVTSLRKVDGQLEAIQTDATVTFGNSGGPMLDRRGDVVGVVVAGIGGGVDINFAIPTHKVETLLKMPAIAVTLPDNIAYGKRFDPVGVKVEVQDIRKAAGGPFSVNVTVGEGEDANTVKAMGRGGSFVAGVQPAEKPKDAGPAADEFEVDLQFDSGAMTVKLKDLPIRVGKHRLRLNEVALVEKKGGSYRVIKTDGTELEGDTLTGPTVTTEFAGERTRVALSNATWIRVFHDNLEQGKGFTVPLTIEVSRGGEVITTMRAAMRVSDPVELDLPDAPTSGKDDPSVVDNGSPLPKLGNGQKYIFDARRQRVLKGWDSDAEIPASSKGLVTFVEKRAQTLTYSSEIDLASLTLEYEPLGKGPDLHIVYGENAYSLQAWGQWFGIGRSKDEFNRVHQQVKTTLEGQKTIKLTIAFPAQGLTTIQVGKSTTGHKAKPKGQLSIKILHPHAFKLKRIEMIPRETGSNAPGMIAEASVYEPPSGAAAIQNNLSVKLPGEYGSFDVGASGRYFIFHVPSKKTIEVIDIVQGKIVHTIKNISDDVIITGGLEHFALVLPGQKLIQKWAFEGFQRVKVARLPGKGATKYALLGTNSSGPLYLSADELSIVDFDTLREIPITGPEYKFGPGANVSADGQYMGILQHYGYRCLHRHKGFFWEYEIKGDSYNGRHIKPTADGRLLFGRRGFIYDTAGNAITAEWLKGMSCYPTPDPRYFIAVQFTETKKRDVFTTHINVCTTADRKIIDTSVGYPEMAPKGNTNSRNQRIRGLQETTQLFHYVPWAKAFCILSWDKKSIRIVKYDLVGQLKSKGIDYLFIQSAPPVFAPRAGKLSYQIDAVSSAEGITYELLDGPKGAKVSETGLVTWDIPAMSENERETIILSVRNKAGEEVLHSFDLTYQ